MKDKILKNSEQFLSKSAEFIYQL